MSAAERWFAPPLRWIAHRGGALEAPENTVPAIRRALRLGADAVEVDVRWCASGTLVVCHDATVDRTTDGRGRVADLALAELRGLDAGYRFMPGRGAVDEAGAAGESASTGAFPLRGAGLAIPSFEEVLAATGDAGLVVEVKEPGASAAEEVVALVDACGASARVLGASFHDEPLEALRRHGLATSASEAELARAWAAAHEIGRLPETAAVALQVPWRHEGVEVVTPPLLRAAAARGLAVHVWIVDDPSEARRLESAGVDGIITDRPGRFLPRA